MGPLGADPYPLPPQFLTLLNLGAFVLFFALGIRGFVWLKPSVDELKENVVAARAEGAEIRAENQKLNAFARDAVMPALAAATAANNSTADALEEMARECREMTTEMRRLGEEFRRWTWSQAPPRPAPPGDG